MKDVMKRRLVNCLALCIVIAVLPSTSRARDICGALLARWKGYFSSSGLAEQLQDPAMIAGMKVISQNRLTHLAWKDMPRVDVGLKVPGYYVARRPMPWDVPQYTDGLLNCVGVALINPQTRTQALLHLVAFRDGDISLQLAKGLDQLGPDMIRQSKVYIVPGIDTLTGTNMPDVGIRNFKETRAFLENALAEVGHRDWLYAVDTGVRTKENRIAIYQGQLLVPEQITDWRYSYRQRLDDLVPVSDLTLKPRKN
jgi:hypothetical protein